MKMKMLYLDMDGVIANFEKRYEELFNQTIKYLSSVKDENVAKGFVTEKLAPKLKWDPQNEQVIAFMKLLDKSFGK
jgi:hydroxymethylpyrimidine pyrophosphatase-like HAD family hydrolase